jgi:dTDP-4-dehydrorhamnose reductase
MTQKTGSRSRPRAVVTGAAGQLGSAIARGFAEDFAVEAFTRAELDITDHQAVMTRVASARPAVILNCAAHNDVDGSEDQAAVALSINAVAVRSLARAAEASGATLVHYSTDFVFDGETDRPYTEDDPPSPQSIYAQSKLVGEWLAQAAPAHYVLRVESLFGGPRGHSSIDRFIAALRSGTEVRAFHDRVVSPSFVDDVASATRTLLARAAPYGLYHCVNSGYDTWLNVAREIAAQLGVEQPALIPVSVSDIPLRASRPRFAALDNARLIAAGAWMPRWQDAVARYVDSLVS